MVYKFNKEEIKKCAHKSGIYAILYNDIAIYIGKSKDVHERLSAHCRDSAFEQTLARILKEDGKCNRCKSLAMYDFIRKNKENLSFTVLEADEDQLSSLEKKYITQYKPKYNYSGVDDKYIA